jgi:hypothetical protein
MDAWCCVHSDTKANVDLQAKRDAGTHKINLKIFNHKRVS